MEINEKTKLIDIYHAYPELEKKLLEMDPRFSIISTPMGKMLMKTKTVQDASNYSGIPVPELLQKLDKLLKA